MSISKVYNMDCMDYMCTIPDNFFDLAVVDPPYGIGMDVQRKRILNPKVKRKYYRKEHVKKSWDNEIPDVEYFNELFRVSKNQVIWGANYFVKHLTKGTKGWLIWYKQQRVATLSDCEIAYSSFNYPTRVVQINNFAVAREGIIHPTQKPIHLYAFILKNCAKPGDKILDTHLGSGSSRIAAFKMGFDFYATELDKDYFQAQEERFKRECHGEFKTTSGGTHIQKMLF